MTDLRKAAEMALEALDWYVQEDDVIESMAGNEPWVEGKRNAEKAIQTLRQALAQKQEPVACIGTNGELIWLKKPKVIYSQAQPLYTAPPKREWVGLTKEEIKEMNYDMRQRNMGVVKTEDIFCEVEAKLKEKNGG